MTSQLPPEPGDEVRVASAGITGRLLARTSPHSSWWSDGQQLNISIVPVEDLTTGEIRWFRSTAVERADVSRGGSTP